MPNCKYSTMRNLHSIANTAALFHRESGQFLGSGFIFRDINTLLTASHCVGELKPSELVVKIYSTSDKTYNVLEIFSHPQADATILKIHGINELEIGWPKNSLFDDRAFGIEVMACGFPEESRLGKPEPTARVFKGHVQRFVNWKSHLGYKYFGAELSFRCPGGLSGGVLCNPEFSGRTYGLIAENVRTSSVLDSIEEVQKDGKIYREHFESIIYYGIAVWLPAIENWIDSIIPPLSDIELNRRAKLQHKLVEMDKIGK